jgi:hypothetical protein
MYPTIRQFLKEDYKELILRMKSCPQTVELSVYEHGILVAAEYLLIISAMQSEKFTLTERSFPKWMILYRNDILNLLPDNDIVMAYALFHDCGKPFCWQVDSEGKNHFPNHATVSHETWLRHAKDTPEAKRIADLILHDMLIHGLKPEGVDEFIKLPDCICLLLMGLAEVYANSELFGGMESTSFKIKYAQIERRGKAICERLFTKGTTP